MFADNTNLTCSGVSTAEIEYKFMLMASKRKLNQIPENLQILINDSLIEQIIIILLNNV